VRGDRLDLIAANVYGNATKWRLIAEYNNIDNPETLKPGQTIMIPEEA
jgi:nucleoid-associated protein YgaU